MDWNNINTDRDTSGLGPIEYDQTRVPALIRKHADNVRTKTYGQEVREAQARNAEYAGLIANEASKISVDVESRQTALESYNDQVAKEMTDKDVISAPEIIQARKGFETLDDRIEKTVNANKDINSISNTGAVLTITSDDALMGDYTHLFPLLKSRGVTASIAIPPSKIGEAKRMSWSQIKELVNDEGWSVMSHSDTEVQLAEVAIEEAERELVNSKTKLEGQGLVVNHLTYPNGSYNLEVQKISKKYFKSSGTIKSGVNVAPVKSQDLFRMSLRYTDIQYLKEAVDTAIANDGWVILYGHGNEFDGVDWTGNIGTLVLDRTREVIDYAISKGVEILNHDEAWEKKGNPIDIGLYDYDGYSEENIVISSNGDLIVNNKDHEQIGKAIVYAGITADTKLTEFKKFTATHTQFNQTQASTSGFPEQRAGSLITHRELSDDYGYQEYRLVNYDRIYTRRWVDSKWNSWKLSHGEVGSRIANTGITSETQPSAFPDFTITHTKVTSAQASTSGFPEQRAGTLVTHKMISDTGYPYQEYHILGVNRVYRRPQSIASPPYNWGSWLQIYG